MSECDLRIYYHSNVYVKIECDIECAHELKEYFSCYAPDYKFHPKFKAKIWNGKIFYYNPMDKLLPLGLLSYLKSFATHYSRTFEFFFDYKELRNIGLEDSFVKETLELLFKGTGISLRDYQEDAICCAMQKKRGVLEMATGAGKSAVLYALMRLIKNDIDSKMLIIVPNISLVTQLYEDFKSYGYDCRDIGQVHGKSKFGYEKRIVISTWQSIYKKPESFFREYHAVMVDETHSAKSSSLSSILKKCTNAHYRIGVTGTLPTEKSDIFNIFGFLGKTIYQLNSKFLIDNGFLSKIMIVNTIIKYNDVDCKVNAKRKYDEEVKFILEHEKRMNVIRYIISRKGVKLTDNILILTHKLSHIDAIIDYVSEKFPNRKILRIDGGVDAESRETIRQQIEKEDGVVLVGSFGTMSTGVNIPKLHHVIFASFYKSKIKVLQSIGRGLRKHDTKDTIYIWDVVDDLRVKKKNKRDVNADDYYNNYAYQHFLERLTFYKQQSFSYVDKHIDIDKI